MFLADDTSTVSGVFQESVAEDQPDPRPIFSLRLIGNDLLKVLDRLEEQSETDQRLHGVSTGLRDWDRITGGFNPGQLYLIASRPGIGKTSLAFEAAFHAAGHQGHLVALFTPGMNREDVILRLLCSEADVDSLAIASGKLSENEWGQLASLTEVAYNSQLFLDDSPSLEIEDISQRGEELAELGLKLIVIDGLDLLKAASAQSSRVEGLGEAARRLKQVALKLRVPVVVTCSVSRAAEQRGSRRPHLTDLPGEGTLEEVADGVFFLYRGFLDSSSYTSEETGAPLVLVEPTELIIAKNPDGPLGMTRLGFVSAFRKFIDWDEALDSPTGF